MGHDSLGNHFKANFSLMQHHKWSLDHMEQMMPWERYIYIELLHAWLKAEEEKNRDLQNELRGKKISAQRRRM